MTTLKARSNHDFHCDMAKGLIRLLLTFNALPQGEALSWKASLDIARRSGFSDPRSETAFLSFSYSALPSLVNAGHLPCVCSGDYTSVWEEVNYYLKQHFGLEPIEPCILHL